MIKKWFEIITDHRISLRERMFRIVSGICMIALIFTLLMGRSTLNIALLAVSLVVMTLIMRYSIRASTWGPRPSRSCCWRCFPSPFSPRADFAAACRRGSSSASFRTCIHKR